MDLGLSYACKMIAFAGWLMFLFVTPPLQANSRIHSLTKRNIYMVDLFIFDTSHDRGSTFWQFSLAP